MAGQLWVTNSLGGYLSANKLTKRLRLAVQPTTKFRQFCDVKDASQQGMHKGATFTWDMVANIATQGTTLVETTIMPESQMTITQGTLTIDEAGNSIPWTGKLDNLSEIPLRQFIDKGLKHDATKFFDTTAEAQFALTPLHVAAATSTTAVVLTTNSATATTNTIAFGKGHARAVVNLMKERNIPPYQVDDYITIARPSTFATLDSDLEGVSQYTETGYKKIVNGERGRYNNMRFIEQTNIAAAKNGTWGQAKSDWMYFFGEDTVAEGIAVPEEIRGKIPTDYGRSKGVAWYYLGGFGIVHNSEVSEARILMWDSLA